MKITLTVAELMELIGGSMSIEDVVKSTEVEQPVDAYIPSDVYAFVEIHRGWAIYECAGGYKAWYGESAYDSIRGEDKDKLVDALVHRIRK